MKIKVFQKKSFIAVADAASLKPFASIADVGCAAGAFPYYLKQRFSNADVAGIEYLDLLLDKAKSDFPEIEFIKGNVLDQKSVTKRFDVITMCGVLCIFDEYQIVLENVLNWINPKGRLILHNMVSEYDIDVFVKYSDSNVKFDPNRLESGWNIISEKSLRLVAEQNNAKILSCENFSVGITLEKKEDVMRSWTEDNLEGEKDIYNGLHIKQPQKIVVIEKL
jgi:trans-aconitate methyltransferase